MGISTWKEPGIMGSITLGGADVKMTDMAAVYGVLANQGNRVNLNPILKITDYRDILEEKKLEKRKFWILNYVYHLGYSFGQSGKSYGIWN